MNAMKLTRERKILMAVLCLGGGALLVDRVLLEDGQTAPQSAAAEQAAFEAHAPDAVSDETEGIMQATMALLSESAEEPMLNERLRETAVAHDASPLQPRDAFAPSAAWREPEAPEPTAEPTSSDPASAKEVAERFRAQHRLDAIMAEGIAGLAIINGRAVRVGQQVQGFTLKRVGQRAAVFTDGMVEVELKVRQP